MVEPRIRYVTTTDGVSLAYWTLGEGTPIVQVTTTPITNAALEWEHPAWRSYYETLAASAAITHYDGRGFGLSERNPPAFSFDTYIEDLGCVMDRVAPDTKVVLLAPQFDASLVAIAYAARHPERVAKLTLYSAVAKRSLASDLPKIKTIRALWDLDWSVYTQAAAHVILGEERDDLWHDYAEIYRRSATPEVLQKSMAGAAMYEVDVSDLLSLVTAPVLALYSQRGDTTSLENATRQLVGALPDAEIRFVDTAANNAPILEHPVEFANIVLDFALDRGAIASPAPVPAVPAEARASTGGAIHTILFTDIVDSTPLMHALGDVRWRVLLREHERITRAALSTHAGAEIKTIGDAFMASFASAAGAATCAIVLQRAFAEHNAANPDTPVRVRIGLNAGEPIAEDGDLFGTAVTLASRINATAGADEILVSDVVRQLVAGRGFAFEDRGERMLKGYEEPVRLHALRWE